MNCQEELKLVTSAALEASKAPASRHWRQTVQQTLGPPLRNAYAWEVHSSQRSSKHPPHSHCKTITVFLAFRLHLSIAEAWVQVSTLTVTVVLPPASY